MDTSVDNEENSGGNTYELKEFDSEQSHKDVSELYETLEAFNSDCATVNTAGHSVEASHAPADDHDIRLLPTDKSNRKKLIYTIAKIVFVAILLVALSVVVVVFLSSRKEVHSDVTSSDENRCLEYSLSNGKVVNATGSREGDSLQVKCNSASKLVGSATLTCLSTGHWSDYPRCIPKECNDFVAPPNGKVIYRNASVNIGATVLVTCEEGFVRKGTEAVVCQSNETWSESPSCEPVDCGMPKNIENGEIRDMTGTTYNNTYTIVCSLGYQLTGVSTVICQLSGLWGETPVCKSIACDIPSIPKNGHIKHLDGTKLGSIATLKCDEGFFITGNPTVTCSADGNWTALPTCDKNHNAQAVECVTPSVDNGDVVNMTGTNHKDAFSVSCFQGYRLKGNKTAICGNDGTWSDLPLCIPVSCGSPVIPRNGYLYITNGTTFKSSALIKCDEGYSVHGNKEIQCKDTGKWTPIPKCEQKDCGAPSDIANGEIKGLTGTKYNDSFSVVCNENHTLVGHGTVSCETNGNWTNVPACIPQTNCGVPPVIENGAVIGVTDTNTFYVKCNKGYHLTGENTLTCDLHGIWSTHPNCQRIDCGAPNISHGIIKGTLNTSYGSIISVSCKTGYSLIGTGTIQCGEDGQWTNRLSCELVKCGLPEVPANGAVENLQGTKINETVSFRCNPGFRLNGTRIITCSNNGKWTDAPTCTQDCGTLPNIENGRIIGQSNTTQNNTFFVQCNNGYVLAGDNIIKCGLNGKWIDLPSCTPVSCGIPDIPRNGMMLTLSGTHFNAIATMKCDEWYALVGNSVISCLSNGSWALIPRCNQIDCGTPNITNGNVNGSKSTLFDNTIHVTCREGYSLTGSEIIRCGINGEWSTIPTCKLVKCGIPDIPANGAISSIQGTTSNKTAVIKCHAGFVLNGTNIVTCSNHGKWTESPKCIPDCGMPHNITNGKIIGLNGTKYNSSFSVECNEGYMLAGRSTIQCTITGNWSELPACISQTDCGVPPNITNGIIRGLSSALNIDTFSVQCNEGFKLKGNATVRCGFYGEWTDVPSCNPVSCGIPEIPRNRKLKVINGTTFLSTASMECDEGFLMEGSSTITCLSNGSWTWIPACEPIDCGTPNVAHGNIKEYTNSSYRSTFYLTCVEGYTLIGRSTVQCGIDGRWSVHACRRFPCGLPDIPENGAVDSMNGSISYRTAIITCNPGYLMNGSRIVTCFSQGKWTKSPNCVPVSDCYDVYQESNTSLSGIYTVTLWQSKRKIQVYCDMDTDGGGWTVFQYRYDGSVDFYNTLSQYDNGFGNLTGEFWLGLKLIQEIARQSKTTLRIDLSAASGTTAYETFQNFYLSGSLYKLHINLGKGTAGDGSKGLWYNYYRPFSTRDRDHDSTRQNCAVTCHGAWWYNSCSNVNLNGEYLTPGAKITKGSTTNGMVYLSFISESLKSSKMMIRQDPVCGSSHPCDLKHTPPSK